MTASARILVVDGEPHLRRTTSRTLKRAGYHVGEAATGHDALRLVKDQEPDLVLLNAVLPDMDGVEVCRRIKDDPDLAGSSVVLIWGNNPVVGDPARGQKAGADDYIVQPVSNQELLARVRAMLRIKRTEDKLRQRNGELGERVKELNCFYGIYALVQRPGISLEEILQETADLIPPTWQYPDVACARIRLDDREFSTANFRETAWRQVSDLVVHGQRSGCVEVCYLEERPESDEGPFLKEERSLINAIAERLGRITERVRAERALEQSERKYRQLLENVQVGIWTIDKDGYTTFVNSRLAEMLGYTADEMMGAHLFAFMEEQGIELAKRKLERQDRRIEEQHDFELMRKDGTWLCARMRTSPLIDDEGNHVGTLASVADITERRRAEEALQETTYLLQTILHHTHMAVAFMDPQFNFIWVNRAYAEADEQEPSFFPGKNHFDLYPDPGNEAIFRRVAETGERYITYANPFEYPAHPERGVSYWDWSLVPIKSPERTVAGLLLTLENVTERVQSGEALRRSEEFNRSIIESSQDCIKILDVDGRLRFMSPAGQQLLHIQDIDPYLDTSYQEFWKGSDHQAAQDAISTAQVGDVGTFQGYCPTEDGVPKWWDVVITPVRGPMGEIDRLLAVSRDITERKRAEEALRRAHDELEIRVQERTAELVQVNETLQAEIEQRRRIAEELRSSEERFRQLAENIREIFWMTDADQNRMLYISPAYEEIAGRTCQSVYERPASFLEVVHPEDREQVWAALARGQAGYDEEYRIVRPDGSLRWIRARTFPIQSEQGEVYRIAGIAEDVTDRVLAYQMLEQRVEERTRELSTLLEISNSAALMLELESLLALILDRLSTVVDYESATIYECRAQGLGILAHRGPIPQEQVPHRPIPLAEVPMGHQVVSNRTPIIIPDVQADTPLAQAFREVGGEKLASIYGHIRSWIGIPLTVKERVLGILTLQRSGSEFFTPAQADLALAFANQAAVVMENARLYEQAQELAALEERQRLARELHDAVSQTLFSASLAAEVLPRLWQRSPDEGHRCLQEVHQLTRSALAEMRTLLLELRPAALIETPLQGLLWQLAEAVTSRVRVPVTVTAEEVGSIPPEVQIALYRIAQEALNNVAKHAAAGQATVNLRRIPSSRSAIAGKEVEGLQLHISDDGCGFDLNSTPSDRMGLCIMRERAEAIGARLCVESQPGQGTQVVVVWPGG